MGSHGNVSFVKQEPFKELDLICSEQRHIHQLVERLDERIGRLSESIKTGAEILPEAPPPAAQSFVKPETKTPDLPPPIASARMDEIPKAVPGSFPSNHAPSPDIPHARETAGAYDRPSTFEMELGRVWLVRIGIVVLLTGLVFLGNLAYQHIIPRLGPIPKLMLFVITGGTLALLGSWMERTREALGNYGRILAAGGFATIYYAAYAAHFVPTLQVIQSPVLGGTVLLAFAGGIGWVAHRKRSETLATVAILLSYYTSAINPVGGFTLFSNLLLTAAAVALLAKNQWSRVGAFSLGATYASYAYWRFFATPDSALAGNPRTQISFLACYWLLFSAVAFIRNRETMGAAARASFATANNGSFFALTAHAMAATGAGSFWIFSLGFGAVLLLLSRLVQRIRPEERILESAYLTQSIALITTGFAMRMTGQQLALTLAAQGTVLLSCGRSRHAKLLEWCGLLSLAGGFVLAFAHGAAGSASEVHAAGIVGMGVLFNVCWFKHQRLIPRGEIHPIATLLSIAGLILCWLWMSKMAGAHLALACMGAAFALAFLQFVELAFFSQALLPVALLHWFDDRTAGLAIPVTDTSLLIMLGIALTYWWPRKFGNGNLLSKTAEYIAAFASVILAATWVIERFPEGDAMAATAIVGVLWIAGARMSGSNGLGFAGLTFSVATVASFVSWQATTHWSISLLPIAHIVVAGLLLRSPAVLAVTNGVAAILLLAWSWTHIPPEWLTLFHAGVGACVAIAAARTRNRLLTLIAFSLGGLSTAGFWIRLNDQPAWPNVSALILFAVGCRFSRAIWPDGLMVRIAAAVSWSTMLGLAARLSRHPVIPSITASWSLLALIFFTAGLLLRDRHYRLGGLGLLGISVGRVFFMDVWGFEPVYRILSFIVLGVVLLLVGYGYNRFEEKLRRWL